MAAPRKDRRLVAILAADVISYSRLIERDEAGTLARLKGHRKELFEPLLNGHGGRLEFVSVVDAVRGAVEIANGPRER